MIDKATTMSVPVGSNTIEKLGLETKWIVGTEQSVANAHTYRISGRVLVRIISKGLHTYVPT